MPPAAFKSSSRVARFISRRIDELRPRRSQTEIAIAAGFASVNMLSMIKDGKAKLPMDRVISLSAALETDPSRMARLALEQFFSGQLLAIILSLSETMPGSEQPGMNSGAAETNKVPVPDGRATT